MEGTHTLLHSGRVEKLAALLLLALSVFVGLLAIDTLKDLFEPRPFMGNSISVDGVGTVTAIPDVATISFSVSEEGTNASSAQESAAEKVNVALALLRDDLGIAEEDIKTNSYNVSPRYEQRQPCFEGYCPPYEGRVIGYTASQSISVKVRDTEKVGQVLSSIGDAGVSNLYGPSFEIDDPDQLRADARALAIADAEQKAKALAKDLGVRLVRVTGFWENSDPYYPYYRSEAAYGLGGDAVATNAVPDLPAGENEIVSRVNVSYEIR